MTLGDAIQDMHNVPCDMTGSGIVRLPSGNFTSNHVALRPRKGTESLSLDDPVNTMTPQNSFFHPIQTHRTLSIREIARLFCLPDDVQFFGSLTSIQKQIGNSVRLLFVIASRLMFIHTAVF